MTLVDSKAPAGMLTRLSRVARRTLLLAVLLAGAACSTESPVAPEPVPTRLAFTLEPGMVQAGAAMVPAARVAVQDDQGNTVTTSTASVSIAIGSGTGAAGATLGGTLTRAAVNGVATFGDLTIDQAAAGYTLTAQSGALATATSAAFTVGPGAASALVLTTQPVTVSAGSPMALQVTVRDAYGNTVTGSAAAISVAIAPGTGATGAVLGGTVTRTPVNGIAAFDGLTIDKAGSGYRLMVTATGVGGATSEPFTVDPGAPSRIAFSGGPAGATAGYRTAPIQAAVQDDQGNTVSGSTTEISIAITNGTGAAGAVLSGTLSRAAVDGVATFDDLSIDQPGTGYMLAASAAGLLAATTSPFDVIAWSGSPTLVSLESDAGDYIGQGQQYEYSQADAVIIVTATGGRLSLSIAGDQRWNAEFQSPDSLARLTPGTYHGLGRYPFHNAATGGLSWSGEGRGCNSLTGSFTVDAVAYDGAALVGIDLRFEQYCEGRAPALRGTIHWDANDPTMPPGPVYPIPAGLWAPEAGSTPATGNYVYLESDPDDYIGQGQTYTYTPASSTISVSSQGVLLAVGVADWGGLFQAMNALTRLQVGYYGDLRRYSFHNATKGGLEWSGQGRGCNRLTGWFAIDTLTYHNGQLTAIEMRFEQRCEEGTSTLRGAIRWTQ